MHRLLSKFKCNVLGWHKSDGNIYYKEGDIFKLNQMSHCKYCGKVIIKDSQGNWFT